MSDPFTLTDEELAEMMKQPVPSRWQRFKWWLCGLIGHNRKGWNGGKDYYTGEVSGDIYCTRCGQTQEIV
jgi:hypothetical protein